MMSSTIETVREADFSADVRFSDGLVAARLAGNADLSAGIALDRFLQSVHDEACTRKVDNVRLDLRDLTFMNSSGLSALLGWVTRIQDLPGDDRYHVTFVATRRLFWQRRSLKAIRSVADDVVSIEA